MQYWKQLVVQNEHVTLQFKTTTRLGQFLAAFSAALIQPSHRKTCSITCIFSCFQNTVAKEYANQLKMRSQSKACAPQAAANLVSCNSIVFNIEAQDFTEEMIDDLIVELDQFPANNEISKKEHDILMVFKGLTTDQDQKIGNEVFDTLRGEGESISLKGKISLILAKELFIDSTMSTQFRFHLFRGTKAKKFPVSCCSLWHVFA